MLMTCLIYMEFFSWNLQLINIICKFKEIWMWRSSLKILSQNEHNLESTLGYASNDPSNQHNIVGFTVNE